MARTLAAACLFGACSTMQAAVLHLKTEVGAPAVIVGDGKLSGRAVDKVTLMMNRAKLAFDIEVLPWQRAYNAALAADDTCVFLTTRLPEREPMFKWVGPLHTIDWTLYGLAERRFKFNRLEDARPYLIGAYIGDARGTFLHDRGFRVASISDDANNPKKLLLQRIDLWSGAKAVSLMEKHGWDGRIVPVLVYHRVNLYLACNPKVPNEQIEKMAAALSAMQRDGSANAIDEQYARWAVP